jgi:hypothetical protein
MTATARAMAMMPAPGARYISAIPAVTGALWAGAPQVPHGLVRVDMPGAVPAGEIAGWVAAGWLIGASDACPQLWQPGTVTLGARVVTATALTTAVVFITWRQDDLVQTGAGMVAVTVGFSFSPGHHVVKYVTSSVVTWRKGQLVTVGAQDVMV